ncbi:MAG: GH92 family glycosyl hydrolase, partial [Muribaculaceae bacterium]|nr:GH92 family glycosyl hydrolase [Muribaculaceae bacterium]
MKRFVNQRILSMATAAFALVASAAGPVDYVNTLMGSQSSHSFSAGNTYPAVALPWGMNFWTPQTGRMGDGWVYTYDAPVIRGLKQTHQPSPWINDYGQFSVMPATGGLVFDEDARASHFSHKAEQATPYYYSVYLADHDVVAEMSPTERAAMMRFTFPQTDSATVVIDAFDGGSSVTVQPDRQRIAGYTTKNSGGVPDGFRNYFIVEFDRPFDFFASVADGEIRVGDADAAADHAGALAGVSTRRGDVVHARVASSFISPEQAELNLRELDGLDFDGVTDAAHSRWNDVLGRIEIADTDSPDRLRTFYSCLYRSVLFPRSFYEIDASGRPVHYSPYNGEIRDGYMFTDTGFWDTFRALFPLLNLLYPSVNERIQAGLVNAYEEGGFLPEWASPGHRGCMVGNNSASVVADAWLSGLRGYDVERLWQAVTHGAHAVHPEVNSTGRLGYELYDSLGYVPCDVGINESAARTLEYAYDDWCIYRLGVALGKPDSVLAPYAAAVL